MNETWWLDPSQLVDEQRDVLLEPPETEMFISGPPGSGKTNILILRANYVREICPRLCLITFTRTLTEFLRSGPNVGRADQIQAAEILTFSSFSQRLIKNLGGNVPAQTGDFDTDRRMIADALSEIISRDRIGKLYDVIFIDEVQSLIREELQIIRDLSVRINAAGDLRQRIYDTRDGIPTVMGMVEKTVEIDHHFRIGEKICEFADQILPPRQGEPPLMEGCNYDEDARPSSVSHVGCGSEDVEFRQCLEKIKRQVRYIVDEPIGVLCIRGDTRNRFWQALQEDGELADISVLQSGGAYQAFGPNSLVRVMTVHSAQGSEFRAVHLLNAEEYSENRRELAFTAVTRAKTELDLYHVGNLAGHMIPPNRQLRSFGSLF